MSDSGGERNTGKEPQDGENALSREHVERHLRNLPLGLRAELLMRLIEGETDDALAPVREEARRRFFDFCATKGEDPEALEPDVMQRIILEMLTREEGAARDG